MKEYIEINDSTKYVNMKTFGFQESGKVTGNPDVYVTYLQHISSGGYIDENMIRPLSQIEKGNIEREIEKIKIEIKDFDSNINEIENDISKYKNKIRDKKDELDKYLDGSLKKEGMYGVQGVEVFSKTKFVITSIFGFMLSIFIFLFYVAASYKGLVMTDGDMAKSFSNGDFGMNVLPHWNEVAEAISNNPMVVIAPFLFFSFGYVIHLLLEKNGYVRLYGIISVVTITFILDFLLAFRIHNKMKNALELMDLPPNNAFEDILIILILGFVAYIIWSIIFHFWFKELTKLNIPAQIGKSIELSESHLEKEERNKKVYRNSINSANEKLQIFEAKLDKRIVPFGIIVQSLVEFTTGWLGFLDGGNESDKLKICKMSYDEFIKNNNVLSYDI